MICNSQKSNFCTNIGHEAFGGACSNCADLRDKPTEFKKQEELRQQRFNEHQDKIEFAREFGSASGEFESDSYSGESQ